MNIILLYQHCIKSTGLDAYMHTLIDPTLFSVTPCGNYKVLFLSCLYKDKYCVSNVCPAHNTVSNDSKTRVIRFCIAMQAVLRAVLRTNMPQDTYTCAVHVVVPDVFSFRPCPRAGCLSEAHNERPPSTHVLCPCHNHFNLQ